MQLTVLWYKAQPKIELRYSTPCIALKHQCGAPRQTALQNADCSRFVPDVLRKDVREAPVEERVLGSDVVVLQSYAVP